MLKYQLNLQNNRSHTSYAPIDFFNNHLNLKKILNVSINKNQEINITFDIGSTKSIDILSFEDLLYDLKDIIKLHYKQHEIENKTLEITKIVDDGLRYIKTFKDSNGLQTQYLQLGANGKYIDRLKKYCIQQNNNENTKQNDKYLINEQNIINKINNVVK